MMEITVLAFGIAKDIFGDLSIRIELPAGANTTTLKMLLENKFPKLKQLGSYMIAVNNEYAENKLVITERDEVAIIPPVSGG
jgi:molybdopterin converting factor subunit 1